MSHYNEATAEMIQHTDDRQNKVKIQKIISDREICQGGYASSDKLTILTDELEKDRDVLLNYIGDEIAIQNYGKSINHNVLSLPCLAKVGAVGNNIPEVEYPKTEKDFFYETNSSKTYEVEESHNMASTTFVVLGDGDAELFESKGRTWYVHNGALYYKATPTSNADKISDLPRGKRVKISLLIEDGILNSWRYPYSVSFMFTLIDGKFVHYSHRGWYHAENITLTTHSNSTLQTYTASYRTVRPNEGVPGRLTRYNNGWLDWRNTASTRSTILGLIPSIFAIEYEIDKEERGGCR